MKQLFGHFRRMLSPRDCRRLIWLTLLMTLGALLEIIGIGLLLPLMAAVTDPELFDSWSCLQYFQSWRKQTDATVFLLTASAAVMLLYLVKNLLAFGIASLQGRFVHAKERELATELFRKFLEAPYSFHLEHGAPELETVMNRSGLMCREIIMPALSVLSDMFTVLVLAILLIWTLPLITLGGITFLVLCGAAVYWPLRRINRELGITEAGHDQNCRRIWLHGFYGIKTIIAADSGTFFEREYCRNRRVVENCRARRYELGQIPRLWLETAAIILVLGIFAVMVLMKIPNGRILLTFGVLIAVLSRMLPAFSRIHYNLVLIRQNQAISDSVFAALSTAPEARGNQDFPLTFNRRLTIKDLGFAYPDGRRVFDGFSLEIPKNSSLAITGPTGGGKTTLVDLLLGLLRPDSGDITADGCSIFDNLTAWRRLAAYVPQNIFLLDDSITANIAFGEAPEKVDVNRVNEAVEGARLGDLIATLPQGLNTVIGENGIRLSGGQRQRIGIARALYRRPELLILDEATSALDGETEAAVIGTLESLYGKVTIVMIAHRLSTIERCEYRIEIPPGK